MKGFKNSTKTHYYSGGEVKGYAGGGSAKYGPPDTPDAPRGGGGGTGGAQPPASGARGDGFSVGKTSGFTGPTFESGNTRISGGIGSRGSVGVGGRVRFAKGGEAKGAAKIAKVMGEFKRGELHSGSKKGPEVKNPKQAIAIALSEAGKSKPVKKAEGGRMMREGISARPIKIGMTPEEKAAARGNRMQALEAREEAKLMREARESRKVTPKAREAVSERRMVQQRDVREPVIRNPLMDALTTLPSQRGEMPMRRKHGGLAAMPGKKC